METEFLYLSATNYIPTTHTTCTHGYTSATCLLRSDKPLLIYKDGQPTSSYTKCPASCTTPPQGSSITWPLGTSAKVGESNGKSARNGWTVLYPFQRPCDRRLQPSMADKGPDHCIPMSLQIGSQSLRRLTVSHSTTQYLRAFLRQGTSVNYLISQQTFSLTHSNYTKVA